MTKLTKVLLKLTVHGHYKNVSAFLRLFYKLQINKYNYEPKIKPLQHCCVVFIACTNTFNNHSLHLQHSSDE